MRVYLKHHVDPGYQAFNIKDVKDIKDAAYQAMRKSHNFLTNVNHEYKIKTNVPLKWGGVKSYFNVIKVYKPNKEKPNRPLCPSWLDDILGDNWFSVEFWGKKPF